ncbi:unnamed protein product [Lota lota]
MDKPEGKPPLKSLFGSQWAPRRPCQLRGTTTLLHQLPTESSGTEACWAHYTCIWMVTEDSAHHQPSPPIAIITTITKLCRGASTPICGWHSGWQGWCPAVPGLARPSGFWTLTQKRDVASGARMLPVAQASAGPSEL